MYCGDIFFVNFSGKFRYVTRQLGVRNIQYDYYNIRMANQVGQILASGPALPKIWMGTGGVSIN